MSAIGTKRHRRRAERYLLLEVKRTSRWRASMSAFDPKRTYGTGCTECQPNYRVSGGGGVSAPVAAGSPWRFSPRCNNGTSTKAKAVNAADKTTRGERLR